MIIYDYFFIAVILINTFPEIQKHYTCLYYLKEHELIFLGFQIQNIVSEQHFCLESDMKCKICHMLRMYFLYD